MGLVIDTSVLISAERRRFDLPAFLEAEEPVRSLFLSAITASELLHGVHRAKGARRRKREAFVDNILDGMAVLPFDMTCARSHAKLWAGLEETGIRIGPHDMLIAATCLTLGHDLATLNQREFRRVEGVRLANTDPYIIKR